MPIKIGRDIRLALPQNQRDGIEEYLWAKSGGRCHLCETAMNPASDSIEADHDDPRVAGGTTDRDNLWLAHVACNRAKRDHPSIDVRPYMKLRAFFASSGHVLRYDGVLPHFGITPQPSKMDDLGDQARFYLPDSTDVVVPVYSEHNGTGNREFRYVFLQVPREALHNDEEVQPRTLKLPQVWAIYSDVQVNPLHEPPSCRLVPARNGFVWLALFDGQHKAVATWMKGDAVVVVKVYLDLTKDEANYLVNSIQAKIKKLPLSPFELSAKLSEEWMTRLDEYRGTVGPEEASEAGFIAWLDTSERTRAKGAFEAALTRELIAAPDLALTKFVHRAGLPKSEETLITETQFSNKVLKRLLHTSPLEETGERGEELRVRERENIIRVLNILDELVFEPEGANGGELSENQLERRRRMIYQGSLSYISDLLKALHRQLLALEPERAFLDKNPTEEHEGLIRQAIQRIVDHPIWTADFDLSSKTKAVRDALSKNQDVERAFSAVGLKLGYVVGADQLPNDWSR